MPFTLGTLPATKGGRKELEDIHKDVIEAVESGFEWCKTNDGRLTTGDAFTTVQDAAKFLQECGETHEPAENVHKHAAEVFLKHARSYAYQREPRVVVTGNPTAKGEARFRVELYVEGQTPDETPPAT